MEKIWLNSYQKNVPKDIDITKYTSIADMFLQTCRKYQNNPAFSNLGTQLSYQEVEKLSRDFAAFCQQQLGLKKGDRIAIMLPNILQYPVVMFGALRAGLIVVNINPLYTAKELSYILNDSKADTIVILANFAQTLQVALKKISVKNIIITNIGDLFPPIKRLAINLVVNYIKKLVPKYTIPSALNFNPIMKKGHQSDLQDIDIKREDIAYLQYTGGTTGISKGAMLSHGNIIANVLQLLAWVSPLNLNGAGSISITALPLYHIFSLTVNCLTLFAMGTQNILITNPRDIPEFIRELKRVKFTTFTGINTLFNALLNHPKFKQLDFSGLFLTFAGGAAIQKAVADQWHQTTGCIIIEGYGLTEASPVVSANPMNLKQFNGAIGLPLPSTDIRIIDENEQDVAVGIPGELCVNGPQVMRGYWQEPELTKNAFTQDGWLKTGDIVTIDAQGYLKIVDRKKDIIIVSGFNVYPNEVEDVLMQHTDILEAVVVGVPSIKTGEAVKAIIVKKKWQLDEETIIKHCQQSLTHYKIPSQIEFRDELPKTPVGKILRRKLKEE